MKIWIIFFHTHSETKHFSWQLISKHNFDRRILDRFQIRERHPANSTRTSVKVNLLENHKTEDNIINDFERNIRISDSPSIFQRNHI